MNLGWMYASDLPLPSGLKLELVANGIGEMGRRRLATLAQLLGQTEASRVADAAGAYELDDDLAGEVKLRGGVLGPSNEIRALSPNQWAGQSQASSLEDLRSRLEREEGKILGLMLNPDERTRFLAFLARNQVDPDSAPEEIVSLARHFFSHEPMNVVVRYTGPRFHHS
ncbi:MAG TPA: hypothetical protein VIH99_09155 [Bdellovibrionota bacterium]|jgi:hypothetical protein